MVLESHVLLCVTEPDFLGKFFLSPKLGKWAQNGSKSGFFQFIGKFGHYFLLNLIFNDTDQNILSQSDCRIF